MTSDLVSVASYWYPFEAEHAKFRLEAEGIRAFVQGDNVVAMNWMIANANRGISVDVASPDAAGAAAILDQPNDLSRGLPAAPGGEAGDEDSGERLFGKVSRRGAFLSWLLLGFPIPVPKWVAAAFSARAIVVLIAAWIGVLVWIASI